MIQIALDGPPGAGKSTLGRALAKKLGILYLDSGAVYRAYALHLLQKAVNLGDDRAIMEAMDDFDFHFEGMKSILKGRDVSEELREQRVADTVKFFGANLKVRAYLTDFMQKLSEGKSLVMDGRDVAGSILPEADLKYFVICDLRVRAERRYSELRDKGENVDFETVLEAIRTREEIEKTRKNAPVIRHPESVIIDSSDKTTEEMVAIILKDIEKTRCSV